MYMYIYIYVYPICTRSAQAHSHTPAEPEEHPAGTERERVLQRTRSPRYKWVSPLALTVERLEGFN